VVFIYDPVDGTLDLYAQAQGDKAIKTELQQIFSRVFLHEDLGAEGRGSHSYDLNGLPSEEGVLAPVLACVWRGSGRFRCSRPSDELIPSEAVFGPQPVLWAVIPIAPELSPACCAASAAQASPPLASAVWAEQDLAVVS